MGRPAATIWDDYHLQDPISQGYFTIPRWLVNSDAWKQLVHSPEGRNARCLMFYCIGAACYHSSLVLLRGEPVTLEPGQLLGCRTTLCKETGLTEQQLRTALSVLKKLRLLTTKVTNNRTIITIEKWPLYRAESYSGNQPNNQRSTSQQHPTNYPPTLFNNSRNEEIEKENIGCLIDLENQGAEALKAFEDFYECYPHKIAKVAAQAKWLELWKKGVITKDLVPAILSAVRYQSKCRKEFKEERRFVPAWPNPAKWLEEGKWNDKWEGVLTEEEEAAEEAEFLAVERMLCQKGDDQYAETI